jgi:hypothetical protein
LVKKRVADLAGAEIKVGSAATGDRGVFDDFSPQMTSANG